MHHDRAGVQGVGRCRVPDEADQGEGMQRHSMIRPGCEVVLVYRSLHRDARGLLLQGTPILGRVVSDVERPQRVGCQNVLS